MKKHKLVNKKWIVIIIIAVLLITFDLLDDQKSISTRAIVLAMSIDITDEGEYELGVQLLKADKNNKQEYLNYFQTGESFSDILELMNYNVGATISLAHTMVIIVSEDFLIKDNDKMLKYLLENQVVAYNTMLVASKQTPKELISTQLSNGIGTGYYMGQILRTVANDCGVTPLSIKDYFMLRYRIGGCVYLPYVSAEKDGETQYIQMTQTFVTDGTNKVILSETATKGLSLVVGNLTNGSLSYTNGEITGGVDIVQSQTKITIEDKTATIALHATLRDTSNVPQSINQNESLMEINKTLIEYIEECYESAKQENLDIFNLGQHCFAENNKLYEQSNYLNMLDINYQMNTKLK